MQRRSTLPLVGLLAATFFACTGADPVADGEATEPAAPAPEAAAPDPAPGAAAAPARDGALPPGTELPDPASLPDVVLITLDTTRADRLGSYGYGKANTDALDRVAARGRRYERAYSPLPLTIPSHATLFTGTYPPTHGIRSNSDQVLGDEFVTLAERLSAVGYRTGASVAAFVTTRRFGFGQGFDVYFDNVKIDQDHWHSERPANIVVDDILGWDAMEDPSSPRFAWVHLYDAHFPYVPRKGYADDGGIRPYDAELAWIDDQVDRLLKGFSDRPTMVVVVGDHGESLGQHNELSHGMQIYDVTQRVPFFMAGPGVPEGEVVEEPVSIADVSPILLDALGLPGLDDAEGVVSRTEDSPPIYMEAYEIAHRFSLAPPVGVVMGALKLIDLPKPELYDLEADPEEETNLAGQRPEDVARLREALHGMGFAPPTAAPGLGGMADGDLTSQLEALGYTAGAQDFDPDEVLPDPKDHAKLLGKSQKSDRMARQEKYEEQARLLGELAEEYPDVLEFHARLARARLRLKDIPGAEKAVDAGLKVDPDNVRLKVDKGAVLAAQRRFLEASVVFDEVSAEVHALAPRIRVMAVMARLQSGDTDGGLELGERYLTEFPDDYNLAGMLGVMYVKRGDFMRALPYLERGILADVPERGVAHHLAAAAAGRGDRAGSIDLLGEEVRNYPDNLNSVAALGRLLLADQKPEAVLDLVAPAMQRSPDVLDLYFLKAQAQFNLTRLGAARTTLDAGLAFESEPPAELVMLEANILGKEGKEEEAKAAYQRALELREAEQQAREDLARAKANAVGAQP